VVADAEACVGLDVVPSELTEAGPAVEAPRPLGDDARHRVAPFGGWCGERTLECGERVVRLGIEHRLGQAVR
jgi:hypothetical protein